ncbi:MAG: MMPL family transporter [Paludibacteraceae bacterium]|nr:MMPL family transporter [Paludibacteraceae bacterium]
MKKKYHLILMTITLLLAVVCGLLMPRVNVNSDMTKYLPDDSRMKQGIEIIASEFGENQLSNSDVKVMFKDLPSSRRQQIADQLALLDEVKGVTFQVSEDSVYTKYDLLVSPSIDQKTFGATIRDHYGKKVIVETSQDGATPPFSALVIAGALILIILIIMSQSWVEPILYLFAIGVAVVLNIGTNALLPSVSITTNYIVAILQLVLSLDYAIVLSNRYRQELSPERDITQSVNNAIKKAYPSILSSAMTTIVGLMMLAFMRVKIGLDLGVVLGKGVICSLMTTFTLLPALLILCHRLIQRTVKRTFVVPTDRLGWFATHHKTSLAISSIVFFGLAFYFSKQTDIYFSTNGESEIEKIFPKTNTIVTVYNTQEEMAMIPLADSLKKDSCVKMVISYPTLLKQQYTAEQLVDYIRQMSIDMADYMPAVDLGILTPEVMKTVYYLRSNQADTLHISFPDLMQFVQAECINNPMFEQLISEDMRAQMALLDEMMNPREEEDLPQPQATAKPVSTPVSPAKEVKPKETVTHPIATKQEISHSASDIAVVTFMPKLYAADKGEMSYYLMTLTDTTELRQEKTVRQMADYIGSTVGQTKMVYSFSKEGKRMTPIEYVHFLTDDLFRRKALAKFVNEEQKNGLSLRVRLMDAANTNGSISADEMADILTELGIPMSEEQVLSIAGKRKERVQPVTVAHTSSDTVKVKESPVVAQAPVAKPKPRKKSRAELQAERFDQLMYGGKAYTSVEMTKQFNYLGQQIDTTTVNLLYCYYGSKYCYNDSLSMSPEQLLAYAADTLVKIDIVAHLIDSATLQMIDSTRIQLAEAVNMLCHEDHSLMIVMTNLPDESKQTFEFIDHLYSLTESSFRTPCYLIGESVMFRELKDGFKREMTIITLLTILAIFVIVAITFQSVVVPTILVVTVMTAVYVNVIVSGLVSGQMLYLAYLIVQSILMGATIDYGILFANYYKEYRRSMEKYDAAREAYHGSIRTIMTSGLIMVLGPGAMALLVDDVTISAIVGCIAVGAFVAILLILVVLPGVLVACDKWVVKTKKAGSPA